MASTDAATSVTTSSEYGPAISKLRVQGLKSLSEETVVSFAPITLIYGPNSAGKSAVLQALLLLAQSLEVGSVDLDPLQARGPLIDVGSFESLLSYHDLRRPLRLGMDVLLEGRRGVQQSVGMDFTYRWNRLSASVEVRDVQMSIEDFGAFTLLRRDPTLKAELDEARRRPSYFAFSDNSQAQAFVDVSRRLAEQPDWGSTSLPPDLGERSAPSNRPTVFQPSGLLPGHLIVGDLGSTVDATPEELPYLVRAWNRYAASLKRELDGLVQRVAYLGPVRQPPQRLHVLSGRRQRNVGSLGEHSVEMLARDSRLVESVNRALSQLDVPYVLSVERLGGDSTSTIGDVVAVVLTDTRNSVRVSPTDVGFGVSQLLPIVVESFLSGRGVVAIEQPEIHLHPRLQAELADVLIETSQLYRTQFVVETHSESLLLRIQRRIREGTLPSGMVSVVYVDRPPASSDAKVVDLRLDESGTFLDEWPSGFFEERFEEIFPGL